MTREKTARGAVATGLAALVLAGGFVAASAGAGAAEWQERPGWGPYPPAQIYPHPYSYSNDAIAAGVAAGIAGSAVGQQIGNGLVLSQPQPTYAPSSVTIDPPAPPVSNPSVPAPSFPVTAGVNSPEWNTYCASKYPNYDAQTGTYVGADGQRQYCQ